MNAIVLAILAIIAAAAAKNLPTFAVLGIVAVFAFVLRRQVADTTRRLLALGQPEDPWAAPSADARRLMKRSLQLAIARTELGSCFPGRAY